MRVAPAAAEAGAVTTGIGTQLPLDNPGLNPFNSRALNGTCECKSHWAGMAVADLPYSDPAAGGGRGGRAGPEAPDAGLRRRTLRSTPHAGRRGPVVGEV